MGGPAEAAEEARDPTALRQAYAAELRRQRIAAGLTQEQLAERVCYSSGLVSMIETCHRPASPHFTAQCDSVLGTGGVLGRLLPARFDYPSWFRSFVELEAEAVSIREVEVQMVPGLLQTEEYARAVLRNSWPPKGGAEIERRLNARVTRQQILDRETPPTLWAIISETVLRVPTGGPAVLRRQLDHLLSLRDRPYIQLQVLTFECAAQAPMGGAFVVLNFHGAASVAYAEGMASSEIITDPTNVERCAMAFQAMQGRAHSPEDSAELITRMIGAL